MSTSAPGAAASPGVSLSAIQLQDQLGYSARGADLALVPVTALLVLLSPMAGRAAGRIGQRLPMTVGPLPGVLGAGTVFGGPLGRHVGSGDRTGYALTG
jgi:hypothetical protein